MSAVSARGEVYHQRNVIGTKGIIIPVDGEHNTLLSNANIPIISLITSAPVILLVHCITQYSSRISPPSRVRQKVPGLPLNNKTFPSLFSPKSSPIPVFWLNLGPWGWQQSVWWGEAWYKGYNVPGDGPARIVMLMWGCYSWGPSYYSALYDLQ